MYIYIFIYLSTLISFLCYPMLHPSSLSKLSYLS
nr:MAG TPA: hypothetical protein [Caudoviricetes sp.]